MTERKKNPLDRQTAVRRNPEALSGLSDSQLLGRFSDVGNDARESAFRELVDRHGPMVMGVCRQVLGIRTTRKTRSRPRFSYSWSRLARSKYPSLWHLGFMVSPLARLSAPGPRLCVTGKMIGRTWRRSRRHRRTLIRSSWVGGFTKSLVDFLKNTALRSCSATLVARPTKRPRKCCGGRLGR